MNLYPGDLKLFTIAIERTDGVAPVITVPPALNVVNLLTGTVVFSSPQAMTAIAGTNLAYAFVWNTAGLSEGTYAALVSYAAEGQLYNGKLLEVVRLGDSRITAPVALEATSAKEATAAKDATVLHSADYTAPDASTLLKAIQQRINGYPVSIPSAADFAALQAVVNNINDAQLGTWSVDKTTNTLTLFRLNGSVLGQYSLTNTATQANRTKL